MTHLKFQYQDSESGKTKIVKVISDYDDTALGFIQWFSRWRQYVFIPNITEETVWSSDCLQDLKEVVETLNNEHRVLLALNKTGDRGNG